jgi:hypothetical protein
MAGSGLADFQPKTSAPWRFPQKTPKTIMQIKVKCGCGSVYSFEEEPINGRLQFPVTCASCGADGTEKAHEYIAAKLSGAPDPTAPKKGALSFLKKKEAGTDSDTSLTPVGSIPDPVDNDSKRLVVAIVGGLIFGILGAIGWFVLTKTTGYEFGFVAWILGGIVGGIIRGLAPRGHHWVGLIAAGAALVAIFGGELLTARWVIGQQTESFVSESYEAAADWAKVAAAATTDDELLPAVATYKVATVTVGDKHPNALTTYQSYQLTESYFVLDHIIDRDNPITVYAKQDEAGDEENVTEQQLAEFKTKVLPELKAFAAGKPSQAEYESALQQMVKSRLTFWSLVSASMHPWSFLWLILGVATAFKVARQEAV